MDPRPDFILVFSLSDEYSPIRSFGETSPAKLKADRAKQLQEEYERLVGRLRACDLEATGRKGAEGTNSILILVRGKEKRILEEVTRERLSDWLHNVASEARPSPRNPRDFVDSPVQETERIRAVYQIMTGPRFKATTSVRSPASTGLTCGIPINLPPPVKSDFPHLISMFPPHNTTFNNTWQKRWLNISTASNNSKNPIELLSIPQAELDELKAHLGGRVALYFAFLCFYFKSLLFPSVVGLVSWVAGLSFHPILGIAFTGWSLLMVESWRLRERALSVHWGSYNIDKVEVQRAGFRGDGLEVDPVTGVTHEKWRFRKTLTRSLAVLPVYFAFVAILGAIISTIYMIETVLGEVYDGPGKKILTMIPTILFVSIVPQVTGFWQFVATKLTDFENHPYQSEYDTSLTIKLFALNFVASYGNLLLTSFIYIPFGAFLVPRIFEMLPSRHAHAIAGSAADGIKSGSFVIDTHKLKRQLVAYSLTAQITNAFTEVGLPYLKTRFGPQIKEKLPQVAEKLHLGLDDSDEKTLSSDSEDEKGFLERIRREQLLPAADLGGEYAEMCTQLGFIALFGVTWPLTPLWSLINNFFEIRSDAFKLATQMRRPVPTREATLGPWLDALGFITYLGTLTTTALVYLYQPQVSYKGVSAEFLSNITHANVTIPTNGTVPFFSTRLSMAQSSGSPAPESPLLMGALPPAPTSFTSLASIQSLLVTALLVAMFSSHAYLVLRGVARWLLERLQWDNSLPHQIVRKGELELKRAWLDENEMRLGPRDMVKKCMEWDNEERRRRLGPDGRKEEDEKKTKSTGETVTHMVEEEMKVRERAQEEEEQYLVGRGMGKIDLARTDGEEFWKREDEGDRVVKSFNKTE